MSDYTGTSKHVGGNVQRSELQRVIDKLEALKTKAPNATDAAISKTVEIMHLMTN